MIEELARHCGVEVRPMDEQTARAWPTLPLAQKRTSRGKAFVRPHGGEVLKGPYPAYALKLVNNLRYPYLLHQLEEGLRLPSSHRGTYRWRRLLVWRGGEGPSYVLAGDSVGRPEGMRVRPASSGVDREFRVIERGSLVRRASEIEKVKRGGRFERHPDFDEEVAVAALQHLYLRFLLGVGDSGTHNVLVRADRVASGRPVAGIDFDEQRLPRERRTALGYFFKQEHAYLEEIYNSYLPRIVLLNGATAAALEMALKEAGTLCARWADALPPGRRPDGPTALGPRLTDMLERDRLIRKLMGAAAGRVAAPAPSGG